MQKYYFFSGMILLYILMSSILRTSGSGAIESSADRIALADGIAALLIFIYFSFYGIKRNIYINKYYITLLPLFFIFLLSAIFAFSPQRSVVEIIAILLGVLLSISIMNILKDFPDSILKSFFNSYVFLLGCLSLVFILDFLFFNVFSRNIGGLTGTFRNTGQAGSFLGVHLAIILSLLLSKIISFNSRNILFTLIIFSALILTFKRAAILGFLIGYGLLYFKLFFSKSYLNKKLFLYSSLIVGIFFPIFYILFLWAKENVEGLSWRAESKFSQDSVEDFKTGFLSENILALKDAFNESPLVGIGLGNVELTDFGFEIHSSYMSIIATSGLLGAIFYFISMFFILYSIFSTQYLHKSQYRDFFYYFLPLFIGLMVSWSYTNHLRKREYWFMLSIVFVIIYFAKRINSSKN